ncbi:MAG: hypothetical protein ACI93H_001814, partial [Psychromonas sp.]
YNSLFVGFDLIQCSFSSPLNGSSPIVVKYYVLVAA